MAIHQAITEKHLNATITQVITNHPDAPVIEKARAAGLTVAIIPHALYASREDHESALLEVIQPLNPDLMVLAGYMRLLSPAFLHKLQTPPQFRIINIHPALLPAFPGTSGYADAFHYGVTISGVTVHYVDEGMDTGPIIAQQAFYRTPDDTLETFTHKGLAIEHQLYPAVLQAIAEGHVRVTSTPEHTFRVQCTSTLFTQSKTDTSRSLCLH
jgi:phosphoribosylglycinamide formyltransferase-1